MNFNIKKLRNIAISSLASTALTFSSTNANFVGVVSNVVGGVYITLTGLLMAGVGIGGGPMGFDMKFFVPGVMGTLTGPLFQLNAYNIWKSDKMLNKCKREHSQLGNQSLQKQILSNPNKEVHTNPQLSYHNCQPGYFYF